ncbi:MAG TPA: copper chaperone PCu(A)C [Rhodanobacteraceae bacterium]|nr:copper chaperone PCu(A)C [Rhodanobacteraceae bacterium]
MIRLALKLVALAALAVCAVAAAASSLKAEHGWVRWLPASLPAAGYVVIRNDGDKPVKLTGADSPDYGMAMLHRSMQKNGSDSMEMVDAIGIPAHGSVALAPGGYHLMLTDAKHAIKPGDTVHVSLHFDDGETLRVTWPVRPANAP